MEPIINPVSLKEQAYRVIKEAILSLQFKPGDPLVEADLAHQLGISKTPVRDALFELEKEGLVGKVLFKGTYVSPLNHDELVQILDVRAVLEGLAARLAALNFSEADLRQAEEILDRQSAAVETGDQAAAAAMNKEFHDLITDRCNNAILKPVLANLDDKLRRYRILATYQAGRLDKSCSEHRLVLEALKARDPGLAEKHLRAHLRSVAEDMSRQDKYIVGEQTYDLTGS